MPILPDTTTRRSCILACLVGLGLCGAVLGDAVATTHAAAGATSRQPIPSDDAAILHLLNRIGFGPRPGDVARVRAIGVQQYIDQQLHPDRLTDAGMPARLGAFTTLGLSLDAIVDRYERPLIEARRQRGQTPGEIGRAHV